jgi:hypothetical protein
VEARLRDVFGIAIGPRSVLGGSQAPKAPLNIRGKDVLTEGHEAILSELNTSAPRCRSRDGPDVMPDDIKMLLDDLVRSPDRARGHDRG